MDANEQRKLHTFEILVDMVKGIAGVRLPLLSHLVQLELILGARHDVKKVNTFTHELALHSTRTSE